MQSGGDDGGTMHMVLAGKWQRVQPSEGLGRPGGTYTADDLLDAWEAGQEHMLKQLGEIGARLLRDNARRSAVLTRSVLNQLRDRDFRFFESRLRVDDVTRYSVLIVVDEDAFVDPSFCDVYDATAALERSARSETFDVSVSFLPVESIDLVNYDALYGDGYNYTLKEQSVA